MSTTTQTMGTDCAEYVRLLHRLHRMTAHGEGDSEAADVIREQMDAAWNRLTPSEVERVTGLSEDLWRLSDGVAAAKGGSALHETFRAARVAFELSDWDRALVLVRQLDDRIPGHLIWYLRGRCWFNLGAPEVALVFYATARAEAPADATYFGAWLESLEAAGRVTELVAAANATLLRHEERTPLHVTTSIVMLMRHWDAARPTDELKRLGELESLLEQSEVERAFKERPAHSTTLAAAAYSGLGTRWLMLNQEGEARRIFGRGLEMYPQEASLLALRGALSYPGEREKAIADLAAAETLSAELVLPSYLLAYDALINDSWSECLRFANRALERADSDLVRAELLEWKAISLYQLGRPPESASALLEEARRLAPENGRIKRNASVVEARTAEWSPQADSLTVARRAAREASSTLLRAFASRTAA